MLDLAAFQTRFARALDAPQHSALAIYRNTVLLGAVDALGDNHPVCRALVGADAFAELAAEYAAAHPPRTAVLADYGAGFAAWVGLHPVTAQLLYLPDVARCERLWCESLHAPDAPALSPTVLAALDAERLLSVRLALHPATRFAWTATPALPIWQAHRAGTGEEPLVEWTACGALFTRPGFAVEGRSLDAGAHGLLAALASGETLGTAAERVLHDHPGADLSAAISLLLASGAFTTITIERPLP